MKKAKLYNYVYLTENLMNGKKYIGDHSTDDLDDVYLGSGLYLKKSIQKHGKQEFRKKILEQCNNKGDAFKLQEKYINKYNTLYPDGYNISPLGGLGKRGCHSEETKRKISLSSKGKVSTRKCKKLPKSHRDNISKSQIGIKNHNHASNITEARLLICKSNLDKDNSGKNNGMYGKKHLDSSKEKNRIAHLKENLSDERRKRMSESAKNRTKTICEYCGRSLDKSNYNQWHGNKCKSKKINEHA